MRREHYVPTSVLILEAWEAAIAFEETGLPVHHATEQAHRDEVTRRHKLNWCDYCGYAGNECGCGDTARGQNVVYLDEADEETRTEYLAEKLTLIGRRLFDCNAVGLDTIMQCAEANSRSQVKL